MEEVVKEIRAIKRLIALAAFSIFVFAISSLAQSLFAFRMMEPYRNLLPQGGYYKPEFAAFSNKANDLLAALKYDELVSLATDQIKRRPDDPYGYYYLGLARYGKADYKGAVESLNRAAELAPTWKDQIIKPYLEAAEKALQAGPK